MSRKPIVYAGVTAPKLPPRQSLTSLSGGWEAGPETAGQREGAGPAGFDEHLKAGAHGAKHGRPQPPAALGGSLPGLPPSFLALSKVGLTHLDQRRVCKSDTDPE